MTASVAKYVAAISNPVADSSAAGGNPQTRHFIYRGASINGPGTATLVPTAQAIRSVFDWFFANGGPGAIPLNGAPTIPGVTPQIADGLTSPSAWEYAGGVSRVFGARASLRADLLVRHYVDFYMRQADTTTGRVQDPTGRSFDLALITNAPDGLLSRDYAGGTFTGTYRFGRMLDIGANYTLSRARGNFDAENVASGPVPFDYRYPEYKQASWNFPEGDLAVDQRHRARIWANYTPDFAAGADPERASGARERRALRRREYQRRRSQAVCHQPEQRLSDAARVDDDDLLLRSARRVPHRRPAPHRLRGQLRLPASRERAGCSCSGSCRC